MKRIIHISFALVALFILACDTGSLQLQTHIHKDKKLSKGEKLFG